MLFTKRNWLYVLVGLVTAISEYTTFTIILYLLKDTSVGLNVAQSISFIFAMMVNFYGSREVTFNSSKYVRSKKEQLRLYLIFAVINLLISNSVITLMVGVVGLSVLIAKIITMTLIAIWTYFVFNKFIFSNEK